MTVCISAIYNNNSILGISDRMVTGGYGDITFEPPIPKILQLTSSIAVMTAGDQDIQIQVYQEVFKAIEEKIKENPEKWINVSEAAEIYSKCYFSLRNRLLENYLLSQFNLTLNSFIERQQSMNKDFVDMIVSKIERFQTYYMNDVETIVSGIDTFGPHIYVVKNGKISCFDKLGFASIGIGSSHAVSHFMFSAYSRFASESKALLTIHQAKKKSEVSPGVGKETDMCVIGPQIGSFTMINPVPGGLDIVKDLDKFYAKYLKQIERIDKKTEGTIQNYLARLGSNSPQKQEVSPTTTVSPSPSISPSESPSPSPEQARTAKRKRIKK